MNLYNFVILDKSANIKLYLGYKKAVKKNHKKFSIISGAVFLAVFIFSLFGANLVIAGTNSKYKEYKNKFKNEEDKSAYFKIKLLKKNNFKLYSQYKSLCSSHKFDTDSQFKKLSIKNQKICKEYYSYKGHKKYLYYRDKHRNNNEENSFVCGTDTIKDSDNNEYDTILINNQCWMAKNINVGTKLSLGTTEPSDNNIIEKWCYNNDSNICNDEGGLYSWNEAMQYSTTEKIQGICPSGWHIPSDNEQYVLENYLKDTGETCDANRPSGTTDCVGAGTNLKSSGSPFFYARLAGLRSIDGSFSNRSSFAYFWSSSEDSTTNSWIRGLNSSTTVMRGTRPKTYGFSVRCIKN